MKRIGIVGALALMAAFGAACGSSTKSTDTTAAAETTAAATSAAAGETAAPAESAAAETQTTVAAEPAAAPAEGVSQGGVIKMLAAEPLDQFDGQGYYGKMWQFEHLTMNCLLDPPVRARSQCLRSRPRRLPRRCRRFRPTA